MLMTLTMPAALETGAEPRPAAAPVRLKVRSADELRNAMRNSRAHPVTLDGTAMNRVLRLDASRGLIEVQAATTWAELAKYLAGRKAAIDAFIVSPGLPPAIGEAVSAAAPGPDGMPDGELRRADRESNTELFRLALGGQGVIGALYSVTLSMESLRASAAEATPPVALEMPQTGCAPQAECALEVLVPPAALQAYLADVRALANERRLTLLGISVRRHRQDASAFLGWARQEWAGVRVRFGFRATLGAGVAAAEIRRALLAAAIERGGSFALRDARDATREQLEACYPTLAAFIAEKRRADPEERLQSAWYRDVVAKLRTERCESRWNTSKT